VVRDGERSPRPVGRSPAGAAGPASIPSPRRFEGYGTTSVGSLVAFVAALLIGGLAIYVSARVVADVDDYGHAVVTALVGAVAWALTS
jgi:hypothetical protein